MRMRLVLLPLVCDDKRLTKMNAAVSLSLHLMNLCLNPIFVVLLFLLCSTDYSVKHPSPAPGFGPLGGPMPVPCLSLFPEGLSGSASRASFPGHRK